MTFCQDVGYKVGDKFRVLDETEGFCQGQIVTLYKDDGTEMPLFAGSNTMWKNCGGQEGAYLHLTDVEPLK